MEKGIFQNLLYLILNLPGRWSLRGTDVGPQPTARMGQRELPHGEGSDHGQHPLHRIGTSPMIMAGHTPK